MVDKGQARVKKALEREAWVADRAANPDAAKWHVNDEGAPGRCSAAQGNCPFSAEMHFFATNLRDAQGKVAHVLEPQVNSTVLTNAGDPDNPEQEHLDFHQLAASLRGREAASGPLNRVEAHLAFAIPGMDKPIKLERRVAGSTISGRQRYATSLVAEGDLGTKLHVENIGNELTYPNDAEAPLGQFFERGRALEVASNKTMKRAYSIWPGMLNADTFRPGSAEYLEAAEESRARIAEAVGFLEWESSIGQEDSMYVTSDESRITNTEVMEKWQRPFTGGAINYGTDAWQPEHLRGITLRNPRNHSFPGRINGANLKTVADGFSVFESDAGAGKASWKMERSGSGWKISMVGSHGQTREIAVATAQEAEAYAAGFFQASVTRRNLQMAADRLESSSGTTLRSAKLRSPLEASRGSHGATRASFLGRVVQESRAHDTRVNNLQEIHANEPPAAPVRPGPKPGRGRSSRRANRIR